MLSIRVKSYIIVLFFIIGINVANGQNIQSKEQYLDSLLNLLTPEEQDSLEFLYAILDDKTSPKNILDISISVFNAQLNRNNSITNKEDFVNLALWNPSIVYTLKNGIGFGYENIIVANKSELVLLQHTATLSYDFTNSEKINFGLFFNKNFTKDSLPYDPTFFDYGFGGNIIYLDAFVQPFVQFSYDKGNFKERFLRRTFNSSISSTNAIIGVQHLFEWNKNKKIGIAFTPKILLNLASQKYKNDLPIPKKRFNTFGTNTLAVPRQITEKFRPQSVGLSLNAIIAKGVFYAIPNIYVDYSVQKDIPTNQKFFGIYGLTVGISF